MPDPVVPPAPPALPDGFNIDSLQGDSWASIMNERFKDNTVALNTKSPLDAINQLTEAQKLIGKKRLPEPQDDWTEDNWNDFYKQLGRPDDPNGYTLEENEIPKIPGMELSDDFMAEAKAALHKAGLTGKQYKGAMGAFFGWLQKSSQTTLDREQTANMEAEASLRKEYGLEYDTRVQQANNLLGQFADPETIKWIGESGMGNNPGFVKMMISIADKFKDDEAIGSHIQSNLSPANQAVREIAEMKNDPDFQKKLFDETNPGHRAAVQKWHDAHKRAFPGAQTR